MAEKAELKPLEHIRQSFAYIEKTVSHQPMLVIAYLVMNVFAAVVSGAAPFARAIAAIIFLVLAYDMLRSLFADFGDEDTAPSYEFRQGGPPLLSLIFLGAMYHVVLIGLLLLLVVPGLWWALKSSLAIVFVSIEDAGAVEALKRSHQMLNNRLMLATKYLLPVNLLTLLPSIVIAAMLDEGVKYVAQAMDWPVAMAGLVIATLLKAVFFLMAQLLVVACLVRLYAFLKNQNAETPDTLPLDR